MSASWDAMVAHEATHGAPIALVPGVAPSPVQPLHKAPSQAGLQALKAGAHLRLVAHREVKQPTPFSSILS